MIASIRLDGQAESLVFDRDVDKPMFSAYLDAVLLHTLKDGDILRHFLIETLCVSIHTLPTLRGKSAVFPLAYGAGVRSRVRQSDAIFNGISL